MTYRVFIDDNFHYQDESERRLGGEFATYEEALEFCKNRVDEDLRNAAGEASSATGLYEAYTLFGEDPWITPDEKPGFSAWAYAKMRAPEIMAELQNRKGNE